MNTAPRLIRVLVFALAVLPCACGPEEEIQDSEQPYPPGTLEIERTAAVVRLVDSRTGVMGTRFSVEIAAPEEDTAKRAAMGAWREIRRLEDLQSTWIKDSLLSRVNRTAAEEPVLLDHSTFDVLRRAKAFHKLSAGAFDPTIGPLLRLWRPLATLERAPTGEEIDAALELVGFDHVRLLPETSSISFDRPGVSIDLGGIGKGYAADHAARAAMDFGATACRVNAGGDLAAMGTPAWSPEGFEVEIRDPAGAESDALPGRKFHVVNRGVATSGNYERFTTVGDRQYSHILDPRTGRPVTDAVVQVTVVGTSGTEADALATALVVLGVEDGLALAEEQPDVEALFLLRIDGRLQFRATTGFPGEPR